MKFYNDIIFLWRNIFNHLCYTMKKSQKTGLTAYAAKPAQFLFLYFSSKPAFYHIHQQLSRSLQSERAAVYKHILHADFHRRALCIMLVEGLTGRICFINDTLCFIGIHVKGIDTVSQAVIIRSIYVDTDVVLEISQDIIGTSSYNYARFTLRKFENYFFSASKIESCISLCPALNGNLMLESFGAVSSIPFISSDEVSSCAAAFPSMYRS